MPVPSTWVRCSVSKSRARDRSRIVQWEKEEDVVDTKPEGNRSVEPLLRRSLRPSSTDLVLTSACLDAETIAAWADGGLSRRDRAAAEAHAAECPRCQAVVAALVKVS